MLTSQNLTRKFYGCKSKSKTMKLSTPFLLLSLILLSAPFTGKGQSDSVKVIPVQTYGLLVEDAVQLRVMEQMVTELTQRISDMEQIQAHIEAKLMRQIAILNAENQERETINANWERSYGVLEKQLGKKEKGNKWLKIGIGAAFVLGLFAGNTQ